MRNQLHTRVAIKQKKFRSAGILRQLQPARMRGLRRNLAQSCARILSLHPARMRGLRIVTIDVPVLQQSCNLRVCVD